MSFFTNLRADRLVTEIRSSTDPDSPAHAEGHRQAEGCWARARSKPILGGAAGSGQERDRRLRRGAHRARQPEDLPAVRRRAWSRAARGSSPASPGRSPAAATTRRTCCSRPWPRPGISKSAVLDVIAAQKTALRRARAAHRRLRAGAEREGGAVPHHRRDRRQALGAASSSGACRARTRSRACTSSTSWRASTPPRCRPRCRRCSRTRTS